MPFSTIQKAGFVLLFISFSTFCFSQLKGKVVEIDDGDSFTLLTASNKPIKIRLYGIDCPEQGQDFSNTATLRLSALIYFKEIFIEIKDTDRYGRKVAMVLINGQNISELLLAEGLAWHYIHYDNNPLWTDLEEYARKAKRGVWSVQNPIPPWEWRKKNR